MASPESAIADKIMSDAPWLIWRMPFGDGLSTAERTIKDYLGARIRAETWRAQAVPRSMLGRLSATFNDLVGRKPTAAPATPLDADEKADLSRTLGLPGRWKMVGLLLITAGVGWATTRIGYMDTEIYFPLVDVNIDLHWLYFPFLFLVIAGTSNGVNLTDGLDGLAAGTCAISLITLLAIAVIDWLRSSPDDVAARSHEYLDIAIVAAALIGGVIGFLWFNAFPAEVFMGDTGSMALGGAIATLAILTETEVLLVFIGGVYLVEILSVMIQVASFKRTGKRVFLMAPIHHHFEMKAWSETKIMVRFWIVGAILCAIGFALYYRYYLRFQL